jgi:DNA-binding response OmpR family regulator
LNDQAVARVRSNGATAIRVLIADPDESLLAEYRGFLSREGFKVVTVLTGLECAARLRERVPDVLVLEPQLPWGGGDGVLAMMREVPDLAIVPVVLLTSCRDPHVLDRLAPFPISDYQVKPLAADRLARRISTCLDDRRPRGSTAKRNSRLERCIDGRTGGRVHNLRVESMDGRVIVHGCCSSYHVRQLALAAVLDALEDSESKAGTVELDLKVCGSR